MKIHYVHQLNVQEHISNFRISSILNCSNFILKADSNNWTLKYLQKNSVNVNFKQLINIFIETSFTCFHAISSSRLCTLPVSHTVVVVALLTSYHPYIVFIDLILLSCNFYYCKINYKYCRFIMFICKYPDVQMSVQQPLSSTVDSANIYDIYVYIELKAWLAHWRVSTSHMWKQTS